MGLAAKTSNNRHLDRTGVRGVTAGVTPALVAAEQHLAYTTPIGVDRPPLNSRGVEARFRMAGVDRTAKHRRPRLPVGGIFLEQYNLAERSLIADRGGERNCSAGQRMLVQRAS